MRIGWVIASRIPAIALASVWRAAKPTTRPSTADEARMPVASRLTDANCASASAMPNTMMTREDQPAHQPQARGGHGRELRPPALEPRARQRAVHDLREHEREQERDRGGQFVAVLRNERGGLVKSMPGMRWPPEA